MLIKIIWQAAVLMLMVADAFNYDGHKTPRPSGKIRKHRNLRVYPEEIHFPDRFKKPISKFVNGTDYEVQPDTPDFRIQEAPPRGRERYFEENVPVRLSPAFKQLKELRSQDQPDTFGCYCCTVFKRLTPLGTCAVLTTRHLLTTASSTELILKDYDKNANLENILGAWYDYNEDTWNSSMYMTPCRIHYHPRFLMPNAVNASHPIPCINDMAVWTSTYPFLGSPWFGYNAYICNRAGSSWLARGSPVPFAEDDAMKLHIIGYQYMLGYRRVPMPWFKYYIKTRMFAKCPKTEWGWFYCVEGRILPVGMDSGAMLHRSNRLRNRMYDGLLGMGSFSMTLRAHILTHYFTSLENYDVLEWLYQAYMGRQKYRYLDGRFYDTQWKAPYPKPWFYIEWKYAKGENNYYPPDREKLMWNK